MPYTWWAVPTFTPLDGIGTWVATANDPVAAAGQVAARYHYGLGFGFVSNPARGVIGLTTEPGAKAAVVSVSGPGFAQQVLSVPYNWTADRFYFLFVHQLPTAGQWGFLVFDLLANQWTAIGALSLPPAWGKLSVSGITAASWNGGLAPTCSAYPQANVVVHAPTGFINGTTLEARMSHYGLSEGATCPAENLIGPNGWVRYRAGAI